MTKDDVILSLATRLQRFIGVEIDEKFCSTAVGLIQRELKTRDKWGKVTGRFAQSAPPEPRLLR